ncbi:MAG: glutathione S-transferase [Halioglobus sp.]|jgi:glutathione S-transferase
MMLTLHGFAFSNYHNIVKHALLQKGVAFDEQLVYPGAPELVGKSPLGKVPAMTTENGTAISESSVMLEYIEDAYPKTSLYPADVDARALVRQLIKISELYLELPARRMLPAVLGNAEIAPEAIVEIKLVLAKGAKAVSDLASFGPYLCGAELTLADIYMRYALAIPKMVGPSKLDWDVMEEVPGLKEWDAMMADTDIARRVDADMRDNTADFMAYVSGG